MRSDLRNELSRKIDRLTAALGDSMPDLLSTKDQSISITGHSIPLTSRAYSYIKDMLDLKGKGHAADDIINAFEYDFLLISQAFHLLKMEVSRISSKPINSLAETLVVGKR